MYNIIMYVYRKLSGYYLLVIFIFCSNKCGSNYWLLWLKNCLKECDKVMKNVYEIINELKLMIWTQNGSMIWYLCYSIMLWWKLFDNESN